ncbi:phage tail tube protein [Acinetobacter sp.]|uniref:phage tail tube protein n=1 Tax=Acinetobacter sp. TaxID=472 RepID=UPI002649E328|nr:phage tail tube protein [Acinetobacter sp.]MDN5511159.1 phage tail tube protein [Acinetobacter sp.]
MVIHIAKEETPNTLPALPVWHTLRRNSDSLKKKVSLTQSDEIVDTRFEQGSIATSGEAVGNIEYDLSALSQDMFFEGVAGNLFVDSGTPSVSTLDIGGDTLPTYTIVKYDKKVGMTQVFSGCRIGELTIQGDTKGKITGSVSISATGYETPAVTPVANPLDATTTPFMSSINVNTFKINGVSTVGTSCAESFKLTINNNLTAEPCLGSESLIPNRYKEGKVSITLNVTLALTVSSKAWIPYVETRQTMTSEIGIEDSLGNAYGFNFTKLELDNDGLSDTNANDDHTLGMEFRHVKEAPTITRTTA